MTRYEYRVNVESGLSWQLGGQDQMESYLNNMAIDGWRLKGFTETSPNPSSLVRTYIFERAIP